MPVIDEDPDRPALDAILQKVLDAVPFQLTTDGGADAARQRFRDVPRKSVHPDLQVEDRTVDGPAGSIPVRVYWPPESESAEMLPIVVFFHGGGWVVGDLDTYDGTAREHAVGAGAVVVSVDYRLAPEHPFPAAVDDVWAVTQWVFANATDLGADSERIAVAGDSAGGNLAAVVAQLARDAGLTLRFQLLWYPATTWDTSLPSFRENADAPVLALDAVGEFSKWYARDVSMRNAPATLIPARGELAGLAPAYIAVAGHDPLRDDGVRYGELLAAAGVPVDVDLAGSLVHGYLGYVGVVPAATEAARRALDALRVALT